jgi:hypothetical protein
VNGVAPGPIWTPLQISGGALEERYENFGNTTVFGRPGQPAEHQRELDDGNWSCHQSGHVELIENPTISRA